MGGKQQKHLQLHSGYDLHTVNTAHSERHQKRLTLTLFTPSMIPFMPFGLSVDPVKWKQVLQDVNQAAGDVVPIGEDPHLQGAVRSTGEDAVIGMSLHLHHTGANVTEDGLLGVLSAERVHESVAC